MPTPATSLEVVHIDPPAPTRPPQRPDWLDQSIQQRREADLAEFQTWLESFRMDDLRAMAQERGWTVRGTRKADVARQVAEALAAPTEVARTMSRLSADQRRILAAVSVVGGLDGVRVQDVERVVDYWKSSLRGQQSARLISEVMTRGLVGLREDYYFGDPVPFIPRVQARSMPPLLADLLPHFPDPPPIARDAELRLADPSAFSRSLMQCLVRIDQGRLPLRPPQPRPRVEDRFSHLKGWDYDPVELGHLQRENRLSLAGPPMTVPPPQPPLTDEVTTHLTALFGDDRRLEFAHALLLAAGIVLPGSPITTWDEVKEAFLRQNEPTQLGILARVYFGMTTWTEVWSLLRSRVALKLMRNPNGFGAQQLTLQTLLAQFAGFRRLVLNTLAWLPDNEWIPLADLLALFRVIWPGLTPLNLNIYYRAQPQQGAWYFTWNGKPIGQDSGEAWNGVHGGFILTMLTGPLHWLGLADLAYVRGEPTLVRLHGLADLFWDRTEMLESRAAVGTASTDAPVDISVHDETIEVNPARLTVEGHALLDRIAHLEQAQPFRFVYRLDVATVHRTFEQGATLEELETGWSAAFGQPMPEAVQSRLAGWWASYGRVRLYRDVSIIEFGDDYALAEMKAVSSLEKLMIAEISPRLVVIPKDAVARLQAELQRAGYTPRQADHE
ncbi:MAG: helicase-associated domain-containing protein [Anaerolineae bacterium]|nr:helicase-associated domain-containing protein [Anaerolineae bacterium]